MALGDTVTFDTDVRALLNDCISGRALDDRLGAYIVMEALAKAKKKGASVGCFAVSTTGEETTGNGAYFTASRVKPNIAIAVDVTYTFDRAVLKLQPEELENVMNDLHSAIAKS